jgi:hypothetical protein
MKAIIVPASPNARTYRTLCPVTPPRGVFDRGLWRDASILTHGVFPGFFAPLAGTEALEQNRKGQPSHQARHNRPAWRHPLLGAANARGSGSSVMFMTWFFNARAIPWRIAYLFRLSESGVRIWGLMYLPPLILRKS